MTRARPLRSPLVAHGFPCVTVKSNQHKLEMARPLTAFKDQTCMFRLCWGKELDTLAKPLGPALYVQVSVFWKTGYLFLLAMQWVTSQTFVCLKTGFPFFLFQIMRQLETWWQLQSPWGQPFIVCVRCFWEYFFSFLQKMLLRFLLF